MLSHKLIQAIESHCDPIMAALICQIRGDPDLTHMRRLPDLELREWGCAILKNLDTWLLAGRDVSLAKRYEALGRLRFEESIPLHEAVHALHLLKDKTIDFVRESGFAQTAAQVYAEEELEYLVGRFFDWLVYHLVRGYEEALRRAAHVAS